MFTLYEQKTAVHIPAGMGPAWWIVGDTCTFKVTGAQTGGAFAVLELRMEPNAGPPLHIHHNEDEAFYVLEGQLEFQENDRRQIAGAGSFVYIPKGTIHRYTNVGTVPAKALVILTPAGFENFFSEVGQPARPGETPPPLGPEEMQRMTEVAARHGLEFVVPDQQVA